MRPRFSLKWLLIGITVCGLLLYLFVRPTARAFYIAAGINDGKADVFGRTIELKVEDDSKDAALDEETCTARLLPLTWEDVYNFRRLVEVTSKIPMLRSRGQRYFEVVTLVGVGMTSHQLLDTRMILRQAGANP
jgi:hypothetical protein